MIANSPDWLVTLVPMPADSEQEQEESSLVERCQDGDREALSELRERNNASLRNILIARGANGSDAEEILAEVWAKCVPGGEQHPSLLEKFNGNCKVQNWLARVATNRWLDAKRQEKSDDTGKVEKQDQGVESHRNLKFELPGRSAKHYAGDS